ncbi:hypothetical protein OHA21_49740 [Actinoplanes sp. NBC_00393]|uniref:hypothetical protein n=1 Tax=Actinoplanes sp. NBC_00393 TaxID=2975953 RepID=UPI002E218BA7
MRRIPMFLAAVLLAAGGCTATTTANDGGSEALCDAFAEVQNTVNQIKNANVSENGLTAIRPYAAELLNQLNQLVLEAKSQFAPQADQLKSSVDELKTVAETARTDPNATNLSAVRVSIQSVRESAENLRDAMSGAC